MTQQPTEIYLNQIDCDTGNRKRHKAGRHLSDLKPVANCHDPGREPDVAIPGAGDVFGQLRSGGATLVTATACAPEAMVMKTPPRSTDHSRRSGRVRSIGTVVRQIHGHRLEPCLIRTHGAQLG